jgi:hypothetical protein
MTKKPNITGSGKGAKDAANGRSRKTSVSNSATIDSKNPIPFDHSGAIFTSAQGRKYVPFVGNNDKFAHLLIEAKMTSPTTLSCVSSKATYCAGKGWFINDNNASEVDKAYPDLDDWAKSLNRKKETLNDLIKLAPEHLLTTGNAFVHIARGKVGNKPFVKVYIRSLLDCRLSEPDEDDICNAVLYGRYFRENYFTFNAEKVIEIPIYSTNPLDKPWFKDEKDVEHTMIHLKNIVAGYEYYGMPSNIASLPQQILEYKASRYNLDNYDNNMVLGGVMVLKGSVTDEEAKKIGKDMVKTHTGDGKRGRWVILAQESGNLESADIKQFEKETEGSYIEFDKHTEEKIYASNQWNKLLIGGSEQKSIGQGNSAYIRSVFDIANANVIRPMQEQIINELLKPLLSICDEWMGTKWKDLPIDIRPLQPVSFLGDVDVNAILTKDEGREIIGYKPIGNEKGQEFITLKTTAAAPAADPNNPANV